MGTDAYTKEATSANTINDNNPMTQDNNGVKNAIDERFFLLNLITKEAIPIATMDTIGSSPIENVAITWDHSPFSTHDQINGCLNPVTAPALKGC